MTGIPSGARQPHKLSALRTRVRHPQIPNEGDKPAVAVPRARGADGVGFGVERRNPQRAAGCRARNRRGARTVPGHHRAPVPIGVPQEQTVVQVRPTQRLGIAVRCAHIVGADGTMNGEERREAQEGREGLVLPILPFLSILPFLPPTVRKWRNWQTRRT